MAGASFKNYSSIAFSVPDGVYAYSVEPNFVSRVGTVTIGGSDVVVSVGPPTVLCATASPSSYASS